MVFFQQEKESNKIGLGKNQIAQDIELLLKCLVYNLTIIWKYS